MVTSEQELIAALPGDGWVADSDPNGWQADYGELAIYTVNPSEGYAVADLLRYIVSGPLHGEWWEGCGIEEQAGHCYRFALDTTKFSRDDVPDAWDAVKGWLVDGSPIRLTDRAGVGTRGTRKHAGLGPVLLAWR